MKPVFLGLVALTLSVCAVRPAQLTGVANGLFADGVNNDSNSYATDTLDPPTALLATGGSSITLNWTPTADTYAAGHRILRSATSGGPYSQIAEVTPRTTSTYVDSPASGTYYYVARSFFQSWESANSNQAPATVGSTTSVVGSSADSYLRSSSANQNQGTLTIMDLNNTRDGVVRFDLSSIPAGSTVISATLTLQATSVGNATAIKNYGAHRILMSWTELGTTWNCGNDTNTANGSPDCPSEGGGWSTAGTGYSTAATSVIPVTGTGAYTWTVTADVAAFVSGGAGNYGWRIIWASNTTGTNRQADFGSRESPSAANRPVLTVVYITP